MSFRFNPCSPCCSENIIIGSPACKPIGIPTCFCTNLPLSLSMTSADANCNYGMFQSCTIAYQARPSWADPLNLAANIYLSTQSFPDPICGGCQFYYYLICHSNQFSLTRLYPTSPYGSPYRDALLYLWNIGGTGVGANTCSNATSPGLSTDYINWVKCIIAYMDQNYPRSDGVSWNVAGPFGGWLKSTTCCPEFYPNSFAIYINNKNIMPDITKSCGNMPSGSCAPVDETSASLRLINGTVFPGSDLSCSVTIIG